MLTCVMTIFLTYCSVLPAGSCSCSRGQALKYCCVVQECAADLVTLHCTAAAAHSLESPYMPVIEKYRCQEWFFTSQVAPLTQLPPGFGCIVSDLPTATHGT